MPDTYNDAPPALAAASRSSRQFGAKYEGGYTRLVDDVDTTLIPARNNRM
ncbi:Uncharacterised protein [Mycobacterium tuberculosis]|nr:Uncharacterised protein [Mycobacterium tuberculosis]